MNLIRMDVIITWTMVLLSASHHLSAVSAAQIVQTAGGLVEGFTDHITERIYLDVDRDVDVYLGIPFAEPPTGRLRFADPVVRSPWDGAWNATYFRPICPQVLPGRLGGKDEDCLYLNVYVPRPVTQSLPVLVWIHGGAYNVGTGGRDWYSGVPLAAFGDVIVVTINYRLGPLGFLSTADEAAPGNFGMMDQILALRWVQDNIAAFGGDPSRVTLSGQSAGATSIGLHLLSPLSRDLFSNAIMQSGSTLTPFSYTDDSSRAREEAFLLGEKLGCRAASSQELIACLRTKSIAQIQASALSFVFLSAPVIDGVFLTGDPELLVAQGHVKRANLLLGTNHDEGTAWALGVFPTSLNTDQPPHMDRDLYDVWHGRFTYGTTNDIILQSMNQEYLDWKNVERLDEDYLDAFVRQITDQTFVAPADKLSRAFVQHDAGDVFLYQMTHVPFASVYEVASRGIGPGWLGVTHGDEFQYVFGWSFIPEIAEARPQLPPEEKVFMADFMRYWLNFVKTGNPNSPETAPWPSFSVPELGYMQLEPGFPISRALRPSTCRFWNTYIPELARISNDAEMSSVATANRGRHSTTTTTTTRSWWRSSWTAENVRRSYPQHHWTRKGP